MTTQADSRDQRLGKSLDLGPVRLFPATSSGHCETCGGPARTLIVTRDRDMLVCTELEELWARLAQGLAPCYNHD